MALITGTIPQAIGSQLLHAASGEVPVATDEIAPSAAVAPECFSVSSPPLCADVGPVRISDVVAPPTHDAPGRLPVSTWCVIAPYAMHKNLTLQRPRRMAVSRCKSRVLLLCAGPNERELSLLNLLVKSGAEGENWDLVNGPTFDLSDDATWDPLVARVRLSEYAAAFASPPCTTASRLRNKPGGPPPLRGLIGASRYGLSGLTQQGVGEASQPHPSPCGRDS